MLGTDYGTDLYRCAPMRPKQFGTPVTPQANRATRQPARSHADTPYVWF
jgi:hypothetical protein